MYRGRSLAALVLLPLCLLSLACSSVQRPTATFRSADVGEVTSEGFLVNFDLDVANPNSFDLPIGSADYAMSIGGIKVVDDKADLDADAIPAGGSKPVRIPVHLSFDSLLKAEKVIRDGGGDIPYEFSGALGFGSNGNPLAALGVPNKVPLKYAGTLPLRKLLSDPAVLLNSPAARRLMVKGLGALLGR